MKNRLCSMLCSAALIFSCLIFPASAASTPVVSYRLTQDGNSMLLTLENANMSVYGVQLELKLSSKDLTYTFTPSSEDTGLASQVSALPTTSGDTLTLYLTSPYSLGQGGSIELGILSASGKILPPTQGALVLLDPQLARHPYTVSLRQEGSTPTPPPSPDPDPTPNPNPSVPPTDGGTSGGSGGSGSSGGSGGTGGLGNSSSSSDKTLSVSASNASPASINQADLKTAKSLTVKGDATLSFDATALKALQNAGATVNVGAAARTSEKDRSLLAQLGGATLYDISLTAAGVPIDLGSGVVDFSVPFAGTGIPVVYRFDTNGRLKKVAMARLENGNAIFSLNGDIQCAVTVLDVAKTFSDVNGWYDGYVNTMVSAQIMQGTGSDLFQPSKTMTRAELVTTLYRMSGESVGKKADFQDVSATSWFADPVAWAKDSGITSGITSTTFGPRNTITREQVATMLTRFLNHKGVTLPQETDATQFSDESKIAPFAKDAVALMQRAGILNGKGDGRFDPKGTATRAECAKMLAVVLQTLK